MSHYSPDLFLESVPFDLANAEDYKGNSNNFKTLMMSKPYTNGLDIQKATMIIKAFNERGYRNKKEKEAALLVVKFLKEETKGRVFILSDLQEIFANVYYKILALIKIPTYTVIGITMLWLIGIIGMAIIFFFIVGMVTLDIVAYMKNIKIKTSKFVGNFFNEENLLESLLNEGAVKFTKSDYWGDFTKIFYANTVFGEKMTPEEKMTLLQKGRHLLLEINGNEQITTRDLVVLLSAALPIGIFLTVGALFIAAIFLLMAAILVVTLPFGIIGQISAIRRPSEIMKDLDQLEKDIHDAPVRY